MEPLPVSRDRTNHRIRGVLAVRGAKVRAYGIPGGRYF
jgi:hypothetical protein